MATGAPYLVNVRVKPERVESQEYPFNLALIRSLDLQFTSATLTVQQPAPNIVLTLTCTFAPPTINGPVTQQTVTCPRRTS